jgi:hypothetical protein
VGVIEDGKWNQLSYSRSLPLYTGNANFLDMIERAVGRSDIVPECCAVWWDHGRDNLVDAIFDFAGIDCHCIPFGPADGVQQRLRFRSRDYFNLILRNTGGFQMPKPPEYGCLAPVGTGRTLRSG